MGRHSILLGLLVLAWHSQAVAQAEDRYIGPWLIDDQAGFCSMQARDGDQTSISFAVSKSDPDRAELRLGNANWQALRSKPRVKINVLINGQEQMLKPVATFSAGGESGVIVPFGKGYLRQVFDQTATIYVSYESSQLLLLHLNDSTNQSAFHAVRQCAGDHHDPFSG